MEMTLTKNFYAWMRTVLLETHTNITSITTNAAGHNGTHIPVGKITGVNGNDITGLTMHIYTGSSYGSTTTIYQTTTLNYWSSGESSGGRTFFSIGSNNTTATIDDYCLGNAYVMNTDYSASWKAISNAKEVNNKGVLSFTLSITAKNDITIGEIGMNKTLYTSSTDYTNVLFGRATLDTPITLLSGESTTFQIDIIV